MLDFTLKTYRSLLKALTSQNYIFKTFEQFIRDGSSDEKTIILRHDVDRLPDNALRVAELEKSLDVRASYYFRVVKQSFDAGIIKEIAGMGHEIGYHYENMATISRQKSGYGIWDMGFGKKKAEGRKLKAERSEQKSGENNETLNPNPKIPNPEALFELAIEDFEKNLEKLRKICPIKTICMHGSPLSKYDSRDLWKVYDYRDFGIIGEPYFDVDFNEVLYLTDTGRRWDGERVSIRDKVSWSEARGQGSGEELSSISKPLTANHSPNSLHSTFDIINAIEKGMLPDKIMINVHPQRWTDKFSPWLKELVFQNLKNIIKRFYT